MTMTIDDLEKAADTALAIMVSIPLDEQQVIYVKADREDFKSLIMWLRTHTTKREVYADLAQPSNVLYIESF